MFENEKVVEVKTCKHCNSSFEITDKDLEFYEKVSPSFAGKKYSIPTPTLCPDCRQQRRLSFRNERKLYKRKCDATGENIISIYSPDKPYKVYNQDFWWSDKWDAMSYGKDFDFNRGFFEQFEELMRVVPRQTLYIDKNRMENSDYCNYGYGCKNSYLCVNSYNSENCFYCTNSMPKTVGGVVSWNIDSIDCIGCDNCFSSIKCKNSYNIYFSFNSDNCNNSWYVNNCLNCNNCIGCVNLVSKDFHILNKKVNKEEYDDFIKNKKFNEEFFKLEYQKLLYKFPNKSSDIINSENSFGDDIIDCKNCKNSFLTMSIENGKYCFDSGFFSKNLFDTLNAGDHGEYLYEANHLHRSYNCSFVLDLDDSKYCFYNMLCYSSSNLFGCIGLRNKEYCILNKQYTKEEYEALVPKIIEHMMKTGEWGEFFPSWVSPFGYNETVAMEYFPLERRDVFEKHLYQDGKQNFKWSSYEPPFPKVDKIIKASMLPEDITKIPDDILNRAIECEVTKKPFRIIAQELDFYRKHNLPIPKRHPDQRHLDRMALRNPRKLFDRKCDKCGKDIKTTYSPDRKEIVYCEECYNREVY